MSFAALRALATAPLAGAVILAAAAVSAVALADSVIAAATIKLAGTTCDAAGASIRPGLTVFACGNVYWCAPAGTAYLGAVLNVPGPCHVERVFAGGFER